MQKYLTCQYLKILETAELNICTDVSIVSVYRKLLVKRCYCDLRKYIFSNRIINIWNSLPDSVVMADTLNQFKHRLGKYWKNYDFVYDHRAPTLELEANSECR